MDNRTVAVVTAGQQGHARGGIPALRSRLARMSKQAEPAARLASAEAIAEAAGNGTVLPRASRTKGDRFRTTCCDI